MHILKAAIMVCDCQKGALVYFEGHQNTGRVAYNMQHRMEAGAREMAGDDGMTFRICADVEVGRCPACDKELSVAETVTIPEDQA